MLNRLTADNDGGAGAQRSAGASFKPSGRGPLSFLGRSYAVGGSSIRGRDGEGERGWGWQARQTQLALWIEEAIRCDCADREVGRGFLLTRLVLTIAALSSPVIMEIK